MRDVNQVTLVGRLTTDPELRSLPSGVSVCKLRVAFSTSRKGASGEWEDKPNYIDVTVWGKQGESVARYLEKGRQIAVQGRLEWREWSGESGKRQAIDIQAEHVQFLGGGKDDGGGGGSGSGFTPRESDVPSSGADDFQPVAPGGARRPQDDDIPF